jgi:hypothetical protein
LIKLKSGTNRTLRKIIKNRGAFPTDEFIQKLLYLALRKASKKWSMPIRNWIAAINRFAIEYELLHFILQNHIKQKMLRIPRYLAESFFILLLTWHCL